MIRLYYNIIINDMRHVHYLCLSLYLVEGTHREHVQLVEVDAPEVAHVVGTLSMLNMLRIHHSKSVQMAAFDGLCFVGQVCHGELNGSVLSTTYIRLYFV